ncbi:GGDEF domain-containing protein [Dyella subtropica]|uniref:GGDEF domain-containing protein n=1 Tax=Dyella subtropica TaxID=2992127 RepID=UPI00224DABE4|nr:GGDEF domain-containing protein [Dyella subtropica]
MRRAPFTGILLFLGLLFLGSLSGTAAAAVPEHGESLQLLRRADSIKTADHPQFVELLKQLDGHMAILPPEQQWYLRYLDAWQVAYEGSYEGAGLQLNAIIKQSPDPTLRFRATATLINILGIGHRYEEAFTRLNQLIDQLPQITDKTARFQGLAEATELLISAGQYDQAATYADQMLENIPPGDSACKAMFYKLHAQFHRGGMQALDRSFQQGVDLCTRTNETLAADSIQADIASFDIQHGQTAQAIALLRDHYAAVKRYQYPSLTSQFEALLAQAYWQVDEPALSKSFALAAIDSSIKDEYTEPLSQAYDLLYRIENRQGNYREALAYHEKYLAADKGYLNSVSAAALAYQVVKQQAQANKVQVDALNKQNRILHLEQALDRKAMENSRLYIILLLTVMVFIGMWLYRLKRSQLRFMWLSRLDGLTGICNRKYFIEETERSLRHAEKAGQSAALVIIDMDHFKLVNDTYGHAVGDQVLKHAVAACQRHLHSRDILGRLGGEEFAILLPGKSPDQAWVCAEQIRLEIAAEPVTGDIAITASIGVASTERSGWEIRQLLTDADHALYRAKRDGRNRVATSKAEDSLVSPSWKKSNCQTSGGDTQDVPPCAEGQTSSR